MLNTDRVSGAVSAAPTIHAEWTDVRIAILVEEHGRGTRRRSIAQIINRATGSTFTKSAVCGKIDRLFPAAKPIKTEEEKAATKARQRERDRLKKQRKRGSQSSAEFGVARRIKRKYESVRIVSANGNSKAMRVIKTFTTDQAALRCVEIKCETSFADVTGCRYTDGDGPFLFCNGQQLAGSSYCEAHFRLCRAEPRPRRDVAYIRSAA